MSEPIIKCEKCKSCDAILFAGAECYTCKIKHLERQLEEAREDVETYKYDLETLVSILHDCLHNMSQEECLDTLRQVDEHYEQLKEKGDDL